MNYFIPSYSMPLATKGMYSSLTSTSIGLSSITSSSGGIGLSSITSSSGGIGESSINTHQISVPFTSSSSSSTSVGPRNFSCEICHKTFPRQGNLDRHRRTHNGDRPFSCDLCPKAFSQRSHLKVHRNTHTGEQTFKCHVCGYSFSRNGNLTRHMRTHQRHEIFANENSYNHNGCNESSLKADDKVQYKGVEKTKPVDHSHQHLHKNNPHHHHHHHHHNNHHSHQHHQHQPQQQQQQQQSYKCAVCSQLFVPVPQHGGSTLYCETCLKTMTNSPTRTLSQHPHFHADHNHLHQSPYQHPTKSKQRLISAAAAAAAIHKYQCQLCGRTFPRNGNLERHKSAHLGLKPFGCDICGRMFGQKSHAKVHKMTHTGERPYKCDVCGFGFSRNGNLVRHRRFNKFSCLVPGTDQQQQQTAHQSGHPFLTGNGTLPLPLPPLPRLPPPPTPPPPPTRTETGIRPPPSEQLPLNVPETPSRNSNPVSQAESRVVVFQAGGGSQRLEPVSSTQIIVRGNADDVVDHVDSNILNTPQMPNSAVE